MRYIFLIVIFLDLTLSALELSFEDLRKMEKSSVLQEFKKLHKERKNTHSRIRQVLKHARSKNLNKNSISFFQAKNTSYIELRKVYVDELLTCESCVLTFTSSANIIGDNTPPITGEINSAIRGTIKNPWSRR